MIIFRIDIEWRTATFMIETCAAPRRTTPRVIGTAPDSGAHRTGRLTMAGDFEPGREIRLDVPRAGAF